MQTTFKATTTLAESDEAAASSSEGRGDARPPTAATLYPGLQAGAGSAKTLLDYYSARAAERRSEPAATTRHQPPLPPPPRHYEQPRVTLGFFPSHDSNANQV